MEEKFNLLNGFIVDSFGHATTIPDFLEFYERNRINFYTYDNVYCGKSGNVFYHVDEARRARLISEYIPEFASKKQRAYDISWLFQNHKLFRIPVAKKTSIAQKYDISMSQIYKILKTQRIIEKNYIDKLFDDKTNKKGLQKENKNSKKKPLPVYVNTLINKYQGVPIIYKGKRILFNKSNYPQLKDLHNNFKVVLNGQKKAILCNDKIIAFSKFRAEFKRFKHSENIDKNLSNVFNIPTNAIQQIRCLNGILLPKYQSKADEESDLLLMIKFVLLLRLFKRIVKRIYKNFNISSDTISIEYISKEFSVPVAHLYRRIKNIKELKELKNDVRLNPPKTNMLICINSKWFDIDSFFPSLDIPFKNINFQ